MTGFCNNCGKNFEVKSVKDRFCSDTCQTTFFDAVFKEKSSSTSMNTTFQKVCCFCKKDFETFIPSQKYCCDECREKDVFIKTNMKGIILQEYTTQTHRAHAEIDKFQFIKLFDRRVCYYCGCKLISGDSEIMGNLTVDHLIPISKGGKNDGNMALACKSCNSSKGDLQTADEYLAYLKQHPEIVEERNRKADELVAAIELQQKIRRKAKRKLLEEY